jgi:hypothetical protein
MCWACATHFSQMWALMPEIITATSRLGLLQKEQAISGIGQLI